MEEVIKNDCLEVLKKIPDNSVDSIVTDPPYGINLIPQRRITKSIKNDKRQYTKELMRKVIPELYRVAKDNTSHLFFGRWSEAWFKDLLEEYFIVKGCIVWVKNNFGIGWYIRPQHEFIWYCHKGKPEKPNKAPSNVWNFKKVHKPIHSCEKPLELMKECVKFCSNEGGLILDPFCGVGNTLVASKILGRNFIGIEIEEEYYEITKRRLGSL